MENWRQYVSPRQRDDFYYELLAGGTKIKLFESFVDHGLASMLANGPMSAGALAQKLALHPLRTYKWLHLLSLVGLLKQIENIGAVGGSDTTYSLTPLAQALFGDDGTLGSFFKDSLFYFKACEDTDLNAVLEGLPLPYAVRWPPQTIEAAAHLEWWMSISSRGTIHAIEKAVDLNKISRLLDVAGGDSTTACEIVRNHPRLNVTIFDLPHSASLAKARIEHGGLADRISVVEGDILALDGLPEGFDLILWSRVFSSWPIETVCTLIEKSHAALLPSGIIVICEPMLDYNLPLALSAEFRYLFYDDFGAGVYKAESQYEALLTQAGFNITCKQSPDEESFYSVIIATKPC